MSLFPRWNGPPSGAWIRIAAATAIATNGSFARLVYKAPPAGWRDIPALAFGFVLWNLLPATFFGIAAILKKRGR